MGQALHVKCCAWLEKYSHLCQALPQMLKDVGVYTGDIMRRWIMALTMSLFGVGQARAADYGDPQGSGVIVGAVDWLQGTLMGTVATTAAVIAVGIVGFMMLTGRVNWRHGAMVILGCFVLFGAASIVAGIRATAGGF